MQAFSESVDMIFKSIVRLGNSAPKEYKASQDS